MPRTRRSVLQISAATTAFGLAGCLGFGGTNETIDVGLRNDDDVAHDLSVTITFDDETLFERTVTLDPGESVTGSFSNPNSAGSARVETALDGGTPTTDSVRVGPGTGLRSVTVVITPDERVRVMAART